MIAIEFENNRTAFDSGERIAGLIRWSELSEPIEGTEVRLIWYTQGKGDPEVTIVEQQIFPTTLATGQSKFEFTAPDGPYSFSGKLISLIWAVEVIALPRRDSESVNIVIAPNGKEVVLSDDAKAVP